MKIKKHNTSFNKNYCFLYHISEFHIKAPNRQNLPLAVLFTTTVRGETIVLIVLSL
jgi:hypothetical protein